jgi:isoleucyl-tRNA synthetase
LEDAALLGASASSPRRTLKGKAAAFVFYEGPPSTAHQAHNLGLSAAKTLPSIQDYERPVSAGGWDTHGLPVEIGVEKKLGFTNKGQIEAYGIDRFNELCRGSAFEYIQEWERFSDRIAFWVDMSEAYVTFTNDYIESVWWILKTFWERGLLYQGYKVVPYCPRCGTPLSDHEVALSYSGGYRPIGLRAYAAGGRARTSLRCGPPPPGRCRATWPWQAPRGGIRHSGRALLEGGER